MRDRWCRALIALLVPGAVLVGLVLAHTAMATPSTAGHSQTVQQVGRGVPVRGRFVIVGGPLTPSLRTRVVPAYGTVAFTAANGRRFRVVVGRHGWLDLRLPAGRYTVVGRTPLVEGWESGRWREGVCALPAPIAVSAGHTTHIHVVCNIA